MDRPRLYPKFNYLLVTGRMSCGGGFNLQNLPRESDLLADDAEAASVRGCFVAGEGNVFIDLDYSQIELVVLGYVWKHQFGLGSSLHDLVNDEQDVHRLIAATVFDKPLGEVTKPERAGAKALSFGRPGGMGASGLQKYAKNSFKQDFSIEEVQERINSYHQLCPELDCWLADEVDAGLAIAETAGLTQSERNEYIGNPSPMGRADFEEPQSWLGWMLLKTLRQEGPATRDGRPYSPEDIDFFWHKAQQLPVDLRPDLAADLQERKPGEELYRAVRNWAGRRPIYTVTGRIRANTFFTASRNTCFQGPAADGTILGMWLLWRAGYKLVNAIHDQVVVESPADDRVVERKAEIERLMIKGMLMVIPGMLVKVETAVTCSLNKNELSPQYCN